MYEQKHFLFCVISRQKYDFFFYFKKLFFQVPIMILWDWILYQSIDSFKSLILQQLQDFHKCFDNIVINLAFYVNNIIDIDRF